MKRIIALILALITCVSLAVTTAGASPMPELIGSFRDCGFNYEFWSMTYPDPELDDVADVCWIEVTDYWGSTLVSKKLFSNGSPYKGFTMKWLKNKFSKEIAEIGWGIPESEFFKSSKYDDFFVDCITWEDNYDKVIPYDDTVNVTVKCVKNGVASTVQFPDQKPVIAKGTTLLPIRAVAEFFDWSVGWETDEWSKKVTVSNGTKTTEFTLGSKGFYVIQGDTSTWKELLVAADLINSRTVVPVRAVAECLDAKVEWDQATYTVTITK